LLDSLPVRSVRHATERPLVRFVVVGTLVTALDFLVFNLLIGQTGTPSKTETLVANTAAFGTAALVGYVLHARYTFRAARGWRSLTTFLAVAGGGALVYDVTLLGLLHAFHPADTLELNVLKAVAAGFASLWNFQGFRILVFRTAKRSSTRA
jgi:putative flippase GtrA